MLNIHKVIVITVDEGVDKKKKRKNKRVGIYFIKLSFVIQ